MKNFLLSPVRVFGVKNLIVLFQHHQIEKLILAIFNLNVN